MAIHEPTRAWPCRSTRAGIVSWPAAGAGKARGRTASSPKSRARAARIARCRALGPRTPACSVGRVPPTTPDRPEKLRPIVRSPIVPTVQPFRALRYAPDVVGDLAAVAAPYDVIDADERRRLVARDPRNVVRIDLPVAEPGDEPDDRYRRAARQLS